MDYYGYAGKVLHVDLSSGDIHAEPLDPDLATKFIGGQGTSYRLAYDFIKPGVHPLSPESPIIIGVGPLVGTLTPCACKTTVVMKFPVPASKRQEKYVVATSVGGSQRFGAMLKYAGYDHVIITGRARKPSYLKIIDDDIEVCDASALWGKADIFQTADHLASKHKGLTGKAGVWAIGKGGENLLATAAALVDNTSSLCTFGAAVLGSKNLKAVVSLGSKGIKVADRKRFMTLVDKMREKIMTHPTFGGTRAATRVRAGEAGYPDDVCTRGVVQKIACLSCPDGCKYSYEIKDGRFKGQWLPYARPQAMVSRGAGRMKLKDYGEMLMLMDALNRAGVSDRTGTAMLHFVVRMFERGVISTKDTGGLVLKTGDFDSYMKLLEKFVNREDIGEYMARGWYALCEKVGVDASGDLDGWPLIRGFDAGKDPVATATGFSPGYGLSLILSPMGTHIQQDTMKPRGEDLCRDTYWPEHKRSLKDIRTDCEKMGTSGDDLDRIFTDATFNTGRLERHAEDAASVYQSVGMDWSGAKFSWEVVRDVPWLSEVYSAATGFEVTPRELKKRGERVWTMGKLLNIREGFTREDEEIPALWLLRTEVPVKVEGRDRYVVDWFGRRINREDIDRMLDDYYDERGWDIEKGIPTREKLVELGLERFAGAISGLTS